MESDDIGVDDTARIWDTATGTELAVLLGHADKVTAVDFSPRGDRLITASHSLVGHADAVWDAAFVDDRRVITAADDGTVRLWTLDDETAPIVLSSGAAGLTSITVLPDGRAVAAADDGSLTPWRIDQLSADSDVLLDRLARATIHCLAIDERMRELGEERREAELAASACIERREQP